MSDLISRQDAIRIIEEDKIDDETMQIMKEIEIGSEAETVNITCDRHIDMIITLPPVQQKSAAEYCAECNHIEMCRWYPYEGCEFRQIDIKHKMKMGAEVIWHETNQDSFKAVIMEPDPDGCEHVSIFTELGCIENVSVTELELTGKYYDHIETLLKFLQMESMDPEKRSCDTCKYHRWSEMIEDFTCDNRKSDFYCRFTESDFSCKEWEQKWPNKRH